MSEAMTAGWVRLMAALRADPDVRVLVVTGEGVAFCSGGDTGSIVREPDARARRRARADAGVLPRVARRARARGADHRRPQRLDGRCGRGAGARVRPAPRRGVRTLLRPVHPARDLTRDGDHRAPARGGRARAPPATSCSRVARSTPRRCCVSDWCRRCPATTASSTASCDSRTPSRPRPRSPYGCRRRRWPAGSRRLATALEWEALAQSVTLATEDALEGFAATRERRAPRFTGR